MKPVDRLGPGWQTELLFARFDGEVLASSGGECLVVRTPHNPTFWWGNFLLFDRAPTDDDLPRWQALFDAHIASRQPDSRHLAFGVDAEGPVLLPPSFVAAGLEIYEATVLRLRSDELRAPVPGLPAGVTLRPLKLPEDAAEAVACQVECDAGAHEPAGYRLFRERQMARYGRMAAAGQGGWFGAWVNDGAQEQLVADCGLFHAAPPDASPGRFQHVETRPARRRRGICRALVHAACRHGFEVMGRTELVIVADPDDVAIGVYESLGFRRHATQWHIERAPRPAQ